MCSNCEVLEGMFPWRTRYPFSRCRSESNLTGDCTDITAVRPVRTRKRRAGAPTSSARSKSSRRTNPQVEKWGRAPLSGIGNLKSTFRQSFLMVWSQGVATLTTFEHERLNAEYLHQRRCSTEAKPVIPPKRYVRELTAICGRVCWPRLQLKVAGRAASLGRIGGTGADGGGSVPAQSAVSTPPVPPALC